MGERLTIGPGRPVRADLGKVHASSTDSGEVLVSHGNLQVRQSRVAREDDAACLFTQLGTLDGVPVCEQHLVSH